MWDTDLFLPLYISHQTLIILYILSLASLAFSFTYSLSRRAFFGGHLPVLPCIRGHLVFGPAIRLLRFPCRFLRD